MKKTFLGFLAVPALALPALAIAVLLVGGCGKTAYKDGTYTGRSGEDDTGAWGEVTLTITGGKVSACEFVTWQRDGTVKDENYGKINGEISNRDFYDKAQLAVAAMKKYAADYQRTGNLNGVEAVSGATIAHNQFLEAVENALEQARQTAR
ncbi:MAG: FMN-binding protein [Treponema sp.]|jgi:major membrane immunogen (membrane-anchored lipoprotein)|nr:FMN-binding protein [Treponema sp.]